MRRNPYRIDESRWPWTPATWWQFWRPRSGAVGASIFALVLMAGGWLIALLGGLLP